VVDIDPNGTGLPGIDQLSIIVGAVMTLGLILSVLALIISAIVWGFGANCLVSGHSSHVCRDIVHSVGGCRRIV